MIADTEFPSYGQWAKKGQTALWERFYDTEEGTLKRVGGGALTSLNHHMFGDITHWFMENIVGLTVLDSYTIAIKPCLITALDFANGAYRRGGKEISLSWQKQGEKIILKIKKQITFTKEK